MARARPSPSAPTISSFSSDEYNSVIVAYQNGAPVRLSDVANVIDGAENVKQAAWMNLTPAVIVNIQRQPGANIISVVDRIKKLLPQLQASLAVVGQSSRSSPTAPNHPRLGRRRAVRTDAHHRAGGDGDLSVPAQSCPPP